MTERLTEEELDRRLAETDVDDNHAEDLGYPVATETGLVAHGLHEWAIAPALDSLSPMSRRALADDLHRAAQRIDFLEGENERYREALTGVRHWLHGWEYVDDEGQRQDVPPDIGKADDIARHSLQQNNDEKGV